MSFMSLGTTFPIVPSDKCHSFCNKLQGYSGILFNIILYSLNKFCFFLIVSVCLHFSLVSDSGDTFPDLTTNFSAIDVVKRYSDDLVSEGVSLYISIELKVGSEPIR